MGGKLSVGTRGSGLAMAQTKIVLDMLKALRSDMKFESVVVTTMGDVLPPRRLGEVDGKAAFTSEIDRQLLDGHVDLAVHSMKDLPSRLDDRLLVGATPEREDPRDVLVSLDGATLSQLRAGAQIGTSSVRRKAQLLLARNDLEVVEIHGNVETRLKKLERGSLDGVVLAAAGLRRLGLEPRVSQYFSTEEMVPAPCQGILAVEARKDDEDVLTLLREIDDPATRAASECERAFAGELGGDCYVPLGAFAHVDSGGIAAVAMIADPCGERTARARVAGHARDAAALGRELASKLSESGGRRILEEVEA